MTATPRSMQDRRPAVVVLRALGLGDLLTAIPALRALADAFPRHPRLLAAPAVLAPLARASGAVDEVIGADGLDEPLHRRLHGAGLAVNLHGRGPESHDLLLATEPRRLVAFTHPAVPASSQGPRWRPDEHEVARWCRLLEESGIAADPGRLDLELPPGRPWHRALWAGTSGDPHGQLPDPGLLAIDVDQVTEALADLPAAAAPRPARRAALRGRVA